MINQPENNGVNVRELALGVMLEVTEEKEYSHIAIRNVLDKYQYMEKRDRAFLTRLCEGTLEQMIYLDYVINQFSSVRTQKMKPVIRDILRLGVYQLLFMDSVPDSAVCNEAVKLAGKKGFAPLKGFVNGVLRNIARNKEEVANPRIEGDFVLYLSVKYSMPEWIIEQWLETYDLDVVRRMLAAFLAERPTTIRCNLMKTTAEELKERLREEGVKVEDAPYLPYALYISGYDYLDALPSFREGLFQVQDISSMLVGEIANPRRGELCLDVCAAPGGKSLHLADKLNGSGRVIARDLNYYKVELIKENIERMGMKNVYVQRYDATSLDVEMEGQADIVLADLPCSGLGTLNKKKDVKYEVTEDTIQELAALQRQILSCVYAYVKPGGTLIYSTCTISQEENEKNMRWFLKHYPFELVSLDGELPEELRGETSGKGYIQLLPGTHECDGFFIAKMRRKAEDAPEG